MAEFFTSSIFGELTKAVQLRFDAVSEHQKKLFDNVLFEDYLDWDVPSIGLNFEELIGQYNITIAAPTIGDNSKEAILGPEGLQTLSEKLLNHAITRPMSVQDYRRVMQLLDSKSISDDAKKQQLIKLMWGDVESVVKSVLAKLDFIFLRGLSNEGVATLDDETNPEGGVRGSIDYQQPSANIATSTTEWTSDNLSTVDPFDDIQSVIELAQDSVDFGKILCAPALISYLCRCTKVKELVWGSDYSTRLVQLSDLNTYMESNGLPTFVPIRRQVRVQKGKTISTVTPWVAANMVFVPDGKLGVVKNAWANNELKQEPGVTYSNYGRIRVSQWGVGETQGSNGVEFTKAEAYALPVITEMNGIYTLKTGYTTA